MVESHKETPSTAALQKKNSSLDDDFAEDFLTSWKSSKVGKDSIDFEVDTVPRSGNKSFYFGKLDDFELAADFDKLSSFKMDLSNLDFPSPCKKAEKPKNKSSKDSGGQEVKQDKFSFTFDFNEFSLDSNLLEKKKTSNFKDGNRLDCSGKQHVDQDSRSNSATINDSIECKTTKSALIEDSMTTSLPEHSVDCGNTKGPGSSISLDPGHQNTTNEARISSEIRTAMSEGNNSEPHSIESQQKQLDGRCCTTKYSENADHTFLLRPVSGDTSETKAVPESDVKLANSDHLLMEAIMGQDNSMKPIYSSQSRNSSPENSSNSQCFPKMSRTKSVNASGKLENQRRNMDEASDGSTLDDEVKGQKDGNASETNATLKSLEETKSTGEKQNASTKLLCSPLNALIRTRIMKENSSAALQLKSLNKAAGNVYCATSAFISKQLHSMGNKNIGTSHSRPLNEERASTRNDEQAENQRRGILKPFDKAGMKNVPVISGRESNSKVCDTSGFQIHPSSMPNQAGVSSMLTEKSPRLVLSISPMTSSITISSETKDICPKDDKQFDISSLANSRLARLNLNSSKSMMQKDTKTVKFCQEKMLSPLSTVPKVATSVITERNALSSPSLKRKVLEQNLLAYISAISSFYDMQVQILHDVGHTRATWPRNMIATFQESKEDPVISNPLKRLRESLAERRNSLEASRQVDKQLIEVSGSPAPPRKEIVVDNQNSPIHPPSMGSMVDFEVPISVEDDGNVTKAEACAKELDDICNMLRKKHDEAKDLLVRAVVNNNTLLMLNHPMFDEKIRAIQNFAKSLLSKEL